MTARSLSLNLGVLARELRLGGRPGPASGSRSRKLCDERVVLLYTPTLLDMLAAKLPASEPFFPRPCALSRCFCGAMPTGIPLFSPRAPHACCCRCCCRFASLGRSWLTVEQKWGAPP